MHASVIALSMLLGFGTGQEEAEAELVGNEMCLICHEVSGGYLSSAHSDEACEDCHGPGSSHVEAGGDNPPRLGDLSTDQLVSRCLSCHGLGESQVSRFSQSAHGTNKIPCVDCHQVHPEKGNFRLLTAEAPTLCVSCHRTVESDFRKPFHHPVLEGGMNCTDCHDPHSDLNRSAHRLETVPGNGCLSCHPSKEGPFVFPHASLEANGCGACHQAHGSFNSKLLVRSQVHQLCLECHTMTAGVATSQPPAIHDLRSARYRNCTICHREIHGSNVNPAFLR